MSLLVSSAFAQAVSGGAAENGGIAAEAVQFAPFVLILVVFYFLFFRPQAQKAKETKAMLGALKRGDRVVTAGGIVATVSRIKDGSNEIEVEIAPNVRVIVLRDTIGNVVKPVAANS